MILKSEVVQVLYKIDASGQKRGEFETLLEGSPGCVAQLMKRVHSFPTSPQCCSTASNIFQEWQGDTVYSSFVHEIFEMRPEVVIT